MNNYLSIITLNVNGLNAPIKRHRIAEWIRKHDPHTCCLQETHLRTKDLHRLKVKGWKQIFQANGQGKKSRGSNTHIRQNRSFATPALFSCLFAWKICFQPFTFSLCKSFLLRWVSCRQHMCGSYFLIHSAIFMSFDWST